MSLQAGQIVRHAGCLWKVDYVNFCRARIIPLNRSHGEREANISPDSPLEVVTDIERARTELELAEAERELAAARAEVKRNEALQRELAEADRELAALKAEAALAPQPVPRSATGGAGWRWTGSTPETKPGSLKAAVHGFVAQHPGATTKAVAEALATIATSGAVAACLDRFWKAGFLEKGVAF